MRASVNQPLRARAERVVEASTPSESAVFKWVIAEKPWLYVIACDRSVITCELVVGSCE
jgi:hypothetical protein